jgi:pyruvate dehydrogenase E2 component (dihydrolipoamide acetyltransferase)
MPREIKMPKLSDTMEEGTLNVWRKAEGDSIAKGDILLEIETDKADMEFEAYMSGTLAKILVPAGETVAIGTPIAIVKLARDSDEDLARFLESRGQAPAVSSAPPAAVASAPAAEPVAAAPGPAPSAPISQVPAPVSPPAAPAMAPTESAALPPPAAVLPYFVPDPDRVRATPRARALARERGVDLSEIAGSGPEGAVLVRDVELYLSALEAAEEPAPGDVPATPVAARIADEHQLDLSRVKASGPGGRVTKRDIREYLEREAKQLPEREAELIGDEIKLSQKRKFLIRNMVESKQSAPHFYISREIDAEPLVAFRGQLVERGARVTYTHMIAKAAALALERHPEVNATFREGRILRYRPIQIAVAVDVQDELLAPVVKDCQGRSLEDLASATDALIQKARDKKLTPEDYSDGTFTISNLGMLGVDHFYAIITPPQSSVLSVGALRTLAVVDPESGEIRPGRRMELGLACDHRVVDGARAARFLAEIVRLLEHPDELLSRDESHDD